MTQPSDVSVQPDPTSSSPPANDIRGAATFFDDAAPLSVGAVPPSPLPDPLTTAKTMPQNVLDWLSKPLKNGMTPGQLHTKWHQDRQDGVAKHQEGKPGNGADFLAMHQSMIAMMRKQFPEDNVVFNGWTGVKTATSDGGANPMPTSITMADGTTKQMPPDLANTMSQLSVMLQTDATGHPTPAAIAEAKNFKNIDALGIFIEEGMHNSIHNFFADSTSPVDMGDPGKNMGNPTFWQLHGFIDNLKASYIAINPGEAKDPVWLAAEKSKDNQMGMGPMPMPMHLDYT